MTEPVIEPTTESTLTAALRTLLLIADDLLLASRVKEGAKPTGLAVVSAATEPAIDAALAAAPSPVAVLVSLTTRRCDPYAAIRRLKSAANPLPVLAFAGHAEREKHARARDAGANLVAANSSVSAHLPALLARLLRGEQGNAALDDDAENANETA